MIQIYHNPRCGKSRTALDFLKNSGKAFEIIHYLQEVPTAAQLIEVVAKLKIKPIDLVRKKEAVWIENFKNKSLSDVEIIQAMVQHPILIERPIIVSETNACIARTPEAFEEI
jgi:arsenate reductase (glutaredoxin)